MRLRQLAWLVPAVIATVAAGAWYWALHTESGARWLWSQAVDLSGGTLTAAAISGDLGGGLNITRVGFTSDALSVSIASVSLAIDVDLLPTRITVLAGTATDARVVNAGKTGEKRSNVRDALEKLRLPFEIVVASLGVEDAELIDDTGASVIFIDSASLSGRWKDEIRVDRFQLNVATMKASGNGSLALDRGSALAVSVELLAGPRLTGLDRPVSVVASLRGSLDELRVDAHVGEPEAALQGRLYDIDRALRWELQLDVPSMPVPAAARMPAVPPMVIAARSQGGLQDFQVDADIGFAGTDMQIGVGADVDLRQQSVSGDLDWVNARWPIGAAEPRISSHEGKVRLGGSLDDWTVDGTVALRVPELPPGLFRIDGHGDRDHAAIEILDGNVLGGNIAGRTRFSWRDARPFSAQLQLADVHSDTLFPEWPALLSGRLELEGQQQPLHLVATIADVSGSFRGRPLAAHGRIQVDADTFVIEDLQVRHGDTNIQIDGHPKSEQGLQFAVTVDDLGHYAEGASGSLRAQGAICLRAGSEFLRLDADASSLGYREWQITDLVVRDGHRPAAVFGAEISAGNLTNGILQVNDLLLRPDLGRDRQSLDLDLTTDGLALGLSIEGVLDDWRRPSAWAGTLSRLQLQHDTLAATLAEPSELRIARDGSSIGATCVDAEAGFTLCAEGSLQTNGSAQVAAHITQLPLGLVNAFVETRFEFDQSISGEVSWSRGSDGKVSGRADFAMSAGTLVSVDEPDLKIETGESSLGFDVAGGELRRGSIDVPLPDLGRIGGDFATVDTGRENDIGIRGNVVIDLSDIGVLAALVPPIDDTSGALRANLDLLGTLAEPTVTGQITVERGSMSYLPIGLRLTDIDLRSQLQERGEIELTGSFRAGDGLGRIRTRADHARTAARGLELTLVGENMTLIDVPDIRAIADTELQVHFDGKTLDLGGNVTVPHARVKPSTLGTTRTFESDDVVIVAGELPDASENGDKNLDLQIRGSMDVALGDDVVLDLGVAETHISGSTRLAWGGDPIPLANGRFLVSGEILALGQRLEITEGSVRFPDVPADDPYLRIRAEREIYGNTQVRRAGVLVAGTVRRPTIEPYTDPLTTEERALTLLVTGSDFDYEKGVGAIDFGTYIAPRVYASYGIGLFDQDNVIRVRYDLGRGFGITGTSGQRDSGVDLSYQFEN